MSYNLVSFSSFIVRIFGSVKRVWLASNDLEAKSIPVTIAALSLANNGWRVV
jgi:hypothetical protein